MSVKLNAAGEVLTAYLEGEIDHHSAALIRNEIDAEVEKMSPEVLILDFKDVSFMDSSGIGLVMGRYKIMKPLGELHVSNTSPHIYNVMKLAGLDRIARMDK